MERERRKVSPPIFTDGIFQRTGSRGGRFWRGADGMRGVGEDAEAVASSHFWRVGGIGGGRKKVSASIYTEVILHGAFANSGDLAEQRKKHRSSVFSQLILDRVCLELNKHFW